jgi:hypothetical protein
MVHRLSTNVIRSRVNQMHYVDITHGKRGFAVTQVIGPFTDERIVKAKRFHLCKVGVK